MDQISRRAALTKMTSTLAASVLAGAAIAHSGTAAQKPGEAAPGSITLDQFLAMDLPDGSGQLLDRLDCTTFAACHERMREENGVWIPELVPVFEKLDAMRAGAATL